MKRIVSSLLFIMLLATGCSFIGHKDNNDSEPIIPAAVQTGGDAVASADNSMAAANTTSANSSNASLPTTISDTSSVSTTASTDAVAVDNGSGEGVTSISSDKEHILITLYYRNKGGFLIPVTRTVAKQEGLAKAAISGLVDDAVTREQLDYYGLYPVLPKGTRIKGMSIKNQVAVIDLSKEFANMESKKDEENAVASVVYTLTGFKTISEVSFRIDGKQVNTLRNGTDLSTQRNRNNTFINSEETGLKGGFVKIDAYYHSNESDKFNYLVPVSLQLEASSMENLPELLITELSKKPGSSELFTSIPEGTKLLSYNTQENVAVLDFSSQINNHGGNEAEKSLVDQLCYTISQFGGINKVKMLIDGKESALTEGTEVASAIAVPATINKIIDK